MKSTFRSPADCAALVSNALRATTISAALCFAAASSTCRAQGMTVAVSAAPAGVNAVSIPGAEGSISRVASGGETLHLVVGHSLFLNTKSRLRRVYVADPAILNSITLTPNQIIVTAMGAGVSSLILLDEAGQAQSYVVSSDVDVHSLRTAIGEAMHNDAVSVEASGGRIILSGNVLTEALAETAVKLAGLYSKDVANSLSVAPEHPKQVRLKVRILEVDRSKMTQFGINLFNPGGNTSFLASSTTSQFPSSSTYASSASGGNVSGGSLTTTNPLNFLLYSTKLNLGATVQDLETKQVLQILAEPTITTISGQKANFLAGGEFPFPVIQPGGGSASNASVTIQFRPYGVKLEFTPIVNDDGTIRLKVAPEVSALDYTNAVTISGYTIPALSTRKAETEVELRNNQSFAISGLLDQRTTDAYSKTPGIASIPIIGALFKSKNINHATTELVVIITPTLVDPLTDLVDPSQPEIPIPTLNTGKFDKSLGNHINPQPAAPPLNPGKPASTNEAPPPPPGAPASPVAPTAQSAAQLPASPAAPSPTTDSVVSSSPAAAAPQPAANSQAADNIISPPQAVPAPQTAIKSQPAEPAPASLVSYPPQKAIEDKPTPTVLASAATQKYVLDATSEAPLSDSPPASIRPADPPPMVQIMAISHKEDAEAMVKALKRHGYNVAVNQDPHDALLHLEVGPFANKTDAEAIQQRLIKDGYNATLK